MEGLEGVQFKIVLLPALVDFELRCEERKSMDHADNAQRCCSRDASESCSLHCRKSKDASCLEWAKKGTRGGK